MQGAKKIEEMTRFRLFMDSPAQYPIRKKIADSVVNKRSKERENHMILEK